MSEEELPEGWLETDLGSLIDGFEAGRNLSAYGRAAEGKEFGVLKISAVTWGEFRPEENKALPPGYKPRPHEVVRGGDLLISRANTADLVGAVVFVDRDYPNLMLPDKILRLRVRQDLVDPRFLLYALRTRSVRSHFAENATGSSESMRNLAQPKIAAAPIRLTTLPRQRRVAAGIETAQSQVALASVHASTLSDLTGGLEQSALLAACCGRLTERWRTEHPDTEPVATALAKVTVAASNTGRAATDTVISGVGILSVGDPQSDTPPGWRWVPLGDVARLESGHTPSRKHPEYWDGDIDWLGIVDARNHHGREIRRTIQRITPAGVENSPARILPKRTVCLSRTASIGYVVILGKPMATSQDFVNWVCSPALMPEFLMYALMAEGSHIRRFGRGTTHTTIYFPEVKAMHICLPPVAEQGAIVATARVLVDGARKVEQHIARARETVKILSNAIIAKAFSGELVPPRAGEGSLEALRAAIQTAQLHAATQPRSKEKTKLATSSSKDDVKAALRALTPKAYTFDEIREHVSADYETLRTALFEVLQEPGGAIRQVFDKKHRAVRLVRTSP